MGRAGSRPTHQLHINDIIETNPDLARAARFTELVLDGGGLPAAEVEILRTAALRHAELAEASKALDAETRRATHRSSVSCLRVLDDEGHRIVPPMQGLRDSHQRHRHNFQLHTLLADAVLGDGAVGFLGEKSPTGRRSPRPATGPSRRCGATARLIQSVGLARSAPMARCRRLRPIPLAGSGTRGTRPTFRYLTARACSSSGRHHTSERGTRAAFFPRMAGELAVEQNLEEKAVIDWLARLTVAPKPERRTK